MPCLFSKCAVKCIGHVISRSARAPSWPGGDSLGAGFTANRTPPTAHSEWVIVGAIIDG